MLSKTYDKKLEGKLTNDGKMDDREPHCLGLCLRLLSGEDEMKWGKEMNSSKEIKAHVSQKMLTCGP